MNNNAEDIYLRSCSPTRRYAASITSTQFFVWCGIVIGLLAVLFSVIFGN